MPGFKFLEYDILNATVAFNSFVVTFSVVLQILPQSALNSP